MTAFNRFRRYRSNASLRDLLQDIHLRSQDLIAPVFIHDKPNDEIIDAMPFCSRYSLSGLLIHCEKLIKAGITTIALFPVIDEVKKTLDCKAAYDENGLISKTIKILKKNFPLLIIIADIALDPFHPQGQDGLLTETGIIDNDRTLLLLAEQALCYAHAGADIVAPSDMMDGRVKLIRQALDQRGLTETLILSYSVKFASHLYKPFRHAVDSARFLGSNDKKTYQMDYRSKFQVPLEALSDEDEKADFLLVKPGLHYLDIIHTLSEICQRPIWSYHVSGECAMLFYAAQNHVALLDDLLLEALFAQKRAGAHKIISYFALEGALLLKKSF
jgi:porphobilinogen synthase